MYWEFLPKLEMVASQELSPSSPCCRNEYFEWSPGVMMIAQKGDSPSLVTSDLPFGADQGNSGYSWSRMLSNHLLAFVCLLPLKREPEGGEDKVLRLANCRVIVEICNEGIGDP